jgi:molybdenum cofactor cytidylyltransferase
MIGRTLPALTIVILAAGYSTRLGRPKALARVHGSTLLARTLRSLHPFAASSRIIVVFPAGAHRYRVGRDARMVRFVANRHRARGLSSSVRLGITHARYAAGVLLLPVDLVHLRPRDIARLIARWRSGRRRVVARRRGLQAATPLILPRTLYARALGVSGDQGLREFVRHLPADMISLVDMPSAEDDVDTAGDLEAARRRWHAPRSGIQTVCTSR